MEAEYERDGIEAVFPDHFEDYSTEDVVSFSVIASDTIDGSLTLKITFTLPSGYPDQMASIEVCPIGRVSSDFAHSTKLALQQLALDDQGQPVVFTLIDAAQYRLTSLADGSYTQTVQTEPEPSAPPQVLEEAPTPESLSPVYTPGLVETHAHLGSDRFEHWTLDAMLEEFHKAGGKAVIVPSTGSEDFDSTAELARHTGPVKLYPCLGVHPRTVREGVWHQQLQQLKTALRKYGPGGLNLLVAIGEIGIDFKTDQTVGEQRLQRRSFRDQLVLALQYDLPVSVHARGKGAVQAVLEELENKKVRGIRGVVHAFPGTPREAERLGALGFYIGVGGFVTYQSSNIRKAVRRIGLDRFLLETDSPFMVPKDQREAGETICRPVHTRVIADRLSSLLDIPVDEVEHRTRVNAKQLFNLNAL
eukprot:gnl/Dysnectes_brevis/378_a420_4372.p1 GENE.gnl/Dysnectes_brevis/378_a420_4372~~gnl/Dysnectes_brevis/378_a420_4372.p1  ORF type:complete len:418 (+),score=85.29 gnl/Dysnectes_brevis/378_a420_4372:99-1352(+)